MHIASETFLPFDVHSTLQILSQDTVILCTEHEDFALLKLLCFCDFMVLKMRCFEISYSLLSVSLSTPTRRNARLWQEIIPQKLVTCQNINSAFMSFYLGHLCYFREQLMSDIII